MRQKITEENVIFLFFSFAVFPVYFISNANTFRLLLLFGLYICFYSPFLIFYLVIFMNVFLFILFLFFDCRSVVLFSLILVFIICRFTEIINIHIQYKSYLNNKRLLFCCWLRFFSLLRTFSFLHEFFFPQFFFSPSNFYI